MDNFILVLAIALLIMLQAGTTHGSSDPKGTANLWSGIAALMLISEVVVLAVYGLLSLL